MMIIIFIPLLCLNVNYIEAADIKVRLEDVKTITLYRGELTAGRRNDPIEQLRCVGGDSCHMYTPDVIQCTNTGSDGLDVNWKCNAELPDYLKFGPLTVSCEGYSYPDDPYILQDSFDQYSSQSGNTRQNFWTGLGLGALGGYFMGRNSGSQRPRSGTTVFTSPSSSRSSSSRSSNMTNSQGFGRTRRR
ncbi:8534_t:CDS:2 [Dentiscutata erythropus]|uniref:Store-operated calcium entry-associated regulatory factor n=1 Tax=Dentiscutata erythropus TaxID=1348616 RepID=A0A9N8YWG9_9GLOM|nr:8534_t:CDS:2 [Dentiscutata erythropus]